MIAEYIEIRPLPCGWGSLTMNCSSSALAGGMGSFNSTKDNP